MLGFPTAETGGDYPWTGATHLFCCLRHLSLFLLNCEKYFSRFLLQMISTGLVGDTAMSKVRSRLLSTF